MANTTLGKKRLVKIFIFFLKVMMAHAMLEEKKEKKIKTFCPYKYFF